MARVAAGLVAAVVGLAMGLVAGAGLIKAVQVLGSVESTRALAAVGSAAAMEAGSAEADLARVVTAHSAGSEAAKAVEGLGLEGAGSG